MTKSNITPKYLHLCRTFKDPKYNCRFQGAIKPDGQRIDVYLCNQGGTLLFRYGNEPHEYHAAPYSDFPIKATKANSNTTGAAYMRIKEVNSWYRMYLRELRAK